MIPQSFGSRFLAILILAVGILMGSGIEATAQQQMSPEQLQQLLDQARARQGLSPAPGDESIPGRLDASAAGSSAMPLLDRPVSRTDYRLGPGDRLTLAVFGYRNEIFSLTVTPEGTVVIPTVGVVSVGGLNLDEATQRARRQVLRFFPGSDVQVSLAAVRSFNIFVVGDVENPGIRPATAVTRVSELVPASDENEVIYRNVTIRRGRDTLQVDLSRFLRSGNLAFNPYVREGDIVQVPAVDATVAVSGEVPFDGVYEFRASETLANLLRIANNGDSFPARAADTLLLMRFSRDPRGEIHRIARADAIGPVGSQMLLQPFDAIYVPRVGNFKEQTTATIQGEVLRPGRYPVRPNVTSIRDLVEMAGGFTAEASPTEVLLSRDAERVASNTTEPLDVIPPEFLTRDERRILRVTSNADQNNVVIDLSRNSQAQDLPVQDSDVLLIPKRREEILVLGAVARPGLFVYTPGQPIEHFVELAGGYLRRADRGDVVVQRTRLHTQLDRKDLVSVEPGDRIVVPFRERTSFLERIQTAQGVINTVSGLVLTIVGLERIWGIIAN